MNCNTQADRGILSDLYPRYFVSVGGLSFKIWLRNFKNLVNFSTSAKNMKNLSQNYLITKKQCEYYVPRITFGQTSTDQNLFPAVTLEEQIL